MARNISRTKIYHHLHLPYLHTQSFGDLPRFPDALVRLPGSRRAYTVHGWDGECKVAIVTDAAGETEPEIYQLLVGG